MLVSIKQIMRNKSAVDSRPILYGLILRHASTMLVVFISTVNNVVIRKVVCLMKG